MSAMAGLKLPKGFEMFQAPTRGGQSASTYSMLSNAFPELLKQAQGAPGAFDAFEEMGQNLFNQKIAPGIAQRYAGSGIGASSGMQNAIAGAGKDLTLGLQAQRANLMHNSMQNVLSLGDLLLKNPDVLPSFNKKSPATDYSQLFLQGGDALGGILKNLIGGPKTDASGKQGIDWGDIASTAAKYLPMLLSLL